MIDHEFTVGDSPSIKVGVRSGRVRVEPGQPGMVRILVDTRDPTFEVVQRGDAISASGERGGRAEVTVHVPPAANIEVSTASADVEVVAGVGRLEVASASGDLRFDTATRLQVKSASGAIWGNRVDGEARCITASGDIQITQVADRADLSTASGDVVIDKSTGTLSIATLSGEIRVHRHTGPDLSVKSMSGGVRIGIPPRTRLELDATTLSGKVILPTSQPSSDPPEREMSVKVRLVSGDLRVVRAD